MSLISTLHVARSGIFTQQSALAITGNNIANVNTDGYTRQRVALSDLPLGGVRVANVERMRDEFLTARLRDSNARLGANSTLALNLQQVESALGESTEQGISKTVRDFFNAWQQLSLKPNGTTERETVRQNAQQLLTGFQSISSQLTQIRDQIDQQVVQQVDRVNLLTSQIAELNKKITGMPTSVDVSQRPELNSVLDSRDKLVDELSSIIQVRVIKDQNGTLTLFGGDQVLVEGNSAHAIGASVNGGNNGYHEVTITDTGGKLISITDHLQEGSLGALLRARDGYALDAQQEVERLAANMARDLNVLHRQGTGLDNVSGRNFFDGLQVTAAPVWNNRGGASVTSTAVLDDTQLTFNDYEIRFNGAGTYDVYNATTGAAVSTGNAYTTGGNIDFAGMRLVVSSTSGAPAVGDVIKINSYANSTNDLSLAAGVAGDLRAIAAGTTSATGDNRNALNIANLSGAATMGTPASNTYEEYYDKLRLRISVATATAQQGEANEQVAQKQVSGLVEGVSGVSTDEEAINIIQFQRAFEASSRVVSVVDELLQTVISMI